MTCWPCGKLGHRQSRSDSLQNTSALAPHATNVAPPTSPTDVTSLPVCTAPHQRRHGQSQSTVSRINSLSLLPCICTSATGRFTQRLDVCNRKRDLKTMIPIFERTFSVKPSHTSARPGLLPKPPLKVWNANPGSVSCVLQMSQSQWYQKSLPATEQTQERSASRHDVSVQCITKNRLDFLRALAFPHEFRPIAEWCKDEQHRRCWHHYGKRNVHERHDRGACSVAKPYCSTFTPSPTTPASAGREQHVLTEMDPASVGNRTRVNRDGVRLRLLVKTTLERLLQPR